MAARGGPPLRPLRRPRPGRGAVRSVLGGGGGASRDRPEPLAGDGPDLPAGLPAAGADDRLPLHCRGGVPAVACHRPRLGRCVTSRRALHGGARIRLAPGHGGRGDPRDRSRDDHREPEPRRQRRPVLRLPHRACLHRVARRRRGAGVAEPARLAGRAGRTAGARARSAGVAGRGDRTGPHRAGDARCGVAQHSGHGDPGRRRLPGPGHGSGPGGRGPPGGLEHRASGLDRHAAHARRPARRAGTGRCGRLRCRPNRRGERQRSLGAAAGTARARRAGRAGAGHRAGRVGPPRRHSLRGLRRGRAHGLSRGAGGPHQRAEARRGAHLGAGAADLHRSRCRRARHRRRPGQGHGAGVVVIVGRWPRPGGHGRTRATSFGGTLRAGPRAAGGWEVEAALRDCKAPAPA